MTTLIDLIEKRIAAIPVNNPNYWMPGIPQTLGNTLDRSLLRRIAIEAAAAIENKQEIYDGKI